MASSTQIINFGILNIGNSAEPVLITSSSSFPAIGDWQSINYMENSSGTVENVTIKYANYGIFIDSNQIKIQNSVFEQNYEAIFVSSRGNPDLGGDSFSSVGHNTIIGELVSLDNQSPNKFYITK